jgi:carbamoyl-phosphate synthase large subunit
LLSVLESRSIDIAFINTEPEIESIMEIRDELDVHLSCAYSKGLLACIDKKILHERLAGLGITARTESVESIADIDLALNEFGSPVWLRCSKGPRGRGSIAIDDIEVANIWMRKIVGELGLGGGWMVHEYLPGRNLNWTSLWKNGELLMSATGERLKYFLADVSISGITGNVSHCRTVDEGGVIQVAMNAVLNADPMPHGIYSVDLKENGKGVPLVTEINARQAFRPLLYSHAGANFSSAFVDAFLYGVEIEGGTLDSAQTNWEMFRGMDIEPIFRKVD